MNRGAKIGLCVGIPVAVFVVLVALDMYAASNLQIARNSAEEFNFASLSIDVTMSVCNPTFFPTSFDKITIHPYIASTRLAEFTIWGNNVPANSVQNVGGRLSLDGMNLLQMFLGAMLGSMAGKQPNFDPNDLSIYMKVEKSILGFIPFSYEDRLSSEEFRELFQSGERNWGCSS